jgi:L-cystine uptake protein TcyP (sodium:dicarboxylate symporter family)
MTLSITTFRIMKHSIKTFITKAVNIKTFSGIILNIKALGRMALNITPFSMQALSIIMIRDNQKYTQNTVPFCLVSYARIFMLCGVHADCLRAQCSYPILFGI